MPFARAKVIEWGESAYAEERYICTQVLFAQLFPGDVETALALALALTSGKALARSQGAETMSKIVAERLVAQLRSSGFVIMRRPIDSGSAPLNPPASWSHTKPEDLK